MACREFTPLECYINDSRAIEIEHDEEGIILMYLNTFKGAAN